MTTPSPQGTVSGKRIEHVSASQVDLYRRCPRLWYFQYVVGKKPPPSPAMQRGTDIHARMETWAKTGKLPPKDDPWHDLASAGVAMLGVEWSPERAALFRVEHQIELPTFEDDGVAGPKWVGFIDLLDLHDDLFRVRDYKTISDFRYVKTPEEIRDNLQLNVYAKYVLSAYSVESVPVGHLYLRTKPPARAHEPPPQILHRDHVERRWEEYLTDVREMSALARQAPPALEVECDTSHCNDYGGCFFRADCGVIPSLFTTTRKGPVMSDFADKLRKRSLRVVEPPPAALEAPEVKEPPTTAPEPVVEVAPRKKTTTCPECLGKKYVPSGNEGGFLLCKKCNATGVVAPNGISKHAAPAPTPASEVGAAIIPPDAPSRSELDAAPPEPEKKTRRRKVTATEPTEQAPKPSLPPPPMGPHTKPDEKAEAKVEAKVEAKAPPAPAPATTTAIESTERKTTRKRPATSPVLYIDTICTKGNAPRATPLEVWMSPIVEAVSDALGLPDYGMDFANKANGALMAAIQESLDTLPEHIFVKSSYRGASVFLEAVIPHAKEVYQGLRG